MLENNVMTNGFVDDMANEMIVDSVATPSVVEGATRNGIDWKSFGLGAAATFVVGLGFGAYRKWRRKTKFAETPVDVAAEQARGATSEAATQGQEVDMTEVNV